MGVTTTKETVAARKDVNEDLEQGGIHLLEMHNAGTGAAGFTQWVLALTVIVLIAYATFRICHRLHRDRRLRRRLRHSLSDCPPQSPPVRQASSSSPETSSTTLRLLDLLDRQQPLPSTPLVRYDPYALQHQPVSTLSMPPSSSVLDLSPKRDKMDPRSRRSLCLLTEAQIADFTRLQTSEVHTIHLSPSAVLKKETDNKIDFESI